MREELLVVDQNLAGASEWIVKMVDNIARDQSSFGSDMCLKTRDNLSDNGRFKETYVDF